MRILTKAGVAAKLHFLDDQPHRHSCEQDNQGSKLFPKNHADQRELARHVPFCVRLIRSAYRPIVYWYSVQFKQWDACSRFRAHHLCAEHLEVVDCAIRVKDAVGEVADG